MNPYFYIMIYDCAKTGENTASSTGYNSPTGNDRKGTTENNSLNNGIKT